MIYFTSDTHFSHRNILKYCDRRKLAFKNIEEHDEHIIAQWNRRVTPRDTVFHAGDFALCPVDKACSILDRLNGKKVLIAGNHDHKHIKSAKFREKFAVVKYGYHEVNVRYQSMTVLICICHYPMQSWNKVHYGSYHLHGHVHGNPVKLPHHHMFDIGIDSHPDLGIWEKDELLDHMHKLLKEKQAFYKAKYAANQ